MSREVRDRGTGMRLTERIRKLIPETWCTSGVAVQNAGVPPPQSTVAVLPTGKLDL